MDRLSHLLAPLADYPRWFVIVCVGLVGIGVGWLLLKLLKWAIHLVILAVVIGLVLFLAAWFFG